jgi:hypothetical protein
MVDRHFGCIKELTKKNHWTGYELVLNMTPTTEPQTVAEVLANISLYHLFYVLVFLAIEKYSNLFIK